MRLVINGLKGQKPSAQGIALSIVIIQPTPCKGKSMMLLPLQGVMEGCQITQGGALGYNIVGLSGRYLVKYQSKNKLERCYCHRVPLYFVTLLWLGKESGLSLLSKITLLPFGRDVTLCNVMPLFFLKSGTLILGFFGIII
jgi:hypothetical protein